MTAGRHATPTILKLITGQNRPGRLHDDKPKTEGMPSPPPGTVLTEAEQEVYDWLLVHVAVPGIHGPGDGAAFVKIARLYARVMDVDRRIAEHGLTHTDEKTKEERLRPVARLSRDLWQQLGAALSEIGATPSGRVRLAGPRSPGDGGGSWDKIG